MWSWNLGVEGGFRLGKNTEEIFEGNTLVRDLYFRDMEGMNVPEVWAINYEEGIVKSRESSIVREYVT